METGDPVPPPWASSLTEVLLGTSQIASRVSEIGASLSAHYEGLNPVLLIVLKGSFIFGADLSRSLSVSHEVQFIRAKSYVGTESTGEVHVTGLEGVDISGRHVVVVEDIVDTGLTLRQIRKKLTGMGAASVESCVFLKKETDRRGKGTPDETWVAFGIEDRFVVGYGLDFDQKFRHLPFVGVMKEA